MPVEMITQTSNVSDVGFYLFGACVIAAALSAVTVGDTRRTALSFIALAITLGALITLEASIIPALALCAVGAIVALLYWQGTVAVNVLSEPKPEMEDGPNRPVAMFIALCSAIVLTPIWINSVWKGHSVEPMNNVIDAVAQFTSGYYLAPFIALSGLSFGFLIFTALLKRKESRD